MTVSAGALIALGVALLIAETRASSRGVLGTLGMMAAVTGIAIAGGSGVALALVLALTVAVVAIAGRIGAVVTRKALSARHERVRCGAEGLVGQVGVVHRPLDPVGYVVIDGELWSARRSWAEEDQAPPAEGECVVVDRVEGLTLSVRRAEPWEVQP
jgi:membrane-bound ClpP family serine protease